MERTFHKSYTDTYNLVKRVVVSLEWELVYENFEKGHIEASSSPSILSWGETIKIKLVQLDQFTTKVSINSAVNSQLFSWGKDSTNEESFIKKLKEISGA